MGKVKIANPEELIQLAAEGRSNLAAAMLEDESVRLASQKRAAAHLKKIDEEDSRMGFWTWAVLWFIFGILFDISVTNLGMHVYKWTQSLGGM